MYSVECGVYSVECGVYSVECGGKWHNSFSVVEETAEKNTTTALALWKKSRRKNSTTALALWGEYPNNIAGFFVFSELITIMQADFLG